MPGGLRGPARLRRHVVTLEDRAPARLLPASPGDRHGLVRHGGDRAHGGSSSAGPTCERCTVRTNGFPANEQLFPQSFALGEIAPGLGPVVEGRRLYTGQIFSQMIMGNLVHTSTVLLRRERLEKVRGFNEEFRISGEDYDFHLRTCREGPVGFIDAATISYRTGMPDRLSGDEYKTHIAMNCLKTVRPWIEEKRSEIKLSNRMIRLRLAEMHAWVGQELLNAGDSLRRGCTYKSLRHQPWQPGAWKSWHSPRCQATSGSACEMRFERSRSDFGNVRARPSRPPRPDEGWCASRACVHVGFLRRFPGLLESAVTRHEGRRRGSYRERSTGRGWSSIWR